MTMFGKYITPNPNKIYTKVRQINSTIFLNFTFLQKNS